MRAVITLHDDFVFYISDTLDWIPSYNPSRKRRQKGLNLYGLTVLDQEGCRQAEEIFNEWATLISLGPRRIRLRGPYECVDNAPGRYSRLEFSRSSLISKLQKLAALCHEVAVSRGEVILAHRGI